ncbi:MAG: cyclic nucleotide-binding domain-containing protein [Acidobacteriota bacterium]|nr:cyclic nucleotide-binding domain-containing protein [Acidobacteriota bacterium]
MQMSRGPAHVPFLSTVDAFAGLDEETLRAVSESLEEVHLNAGSILFAQGDPGDGLYFVASGRLAILLESPAKAKLTLALLAPGECVGEMSLLDRRPRAATARALRASTLLKLSHASFDGLVERHPAIRDRLAALSSRRLPSLRLADTELFRGLESAVLSEFDQESNWVRLEGGRELFWQGEKADCLYVVVRGRLEVLVSTDSGEERVVERLGRGSTVGEMALLTDEPRSATVRAVRDSELVRVPKDAFFRLLENHPAPALALSRSLVRHLRNTTARSGPERGVSTIALLPAGPEGVDAGFVRDLVTALQQCGSTVLHVDRACVEHALGAGAADAGLDDSGSSRVLEWLNEQEDLFSCLLFEGDGAHARWTSRCLRHADLVLVVAAGDGTPPASAQPAAEMTVREGGRRAAARQELVLLHPRGTPRPRSTAAWLDAWPLIGHHHVRAGEAGDVRRLARILTGTALSVAFSGGGARGFAHIGVLKALRELGLAVDLVGGTSMGSIIAAQVAMGLTPEEMVETNRRGFVGLKIFRDLTPPFVALFTARRSMRMLETMFGDLRIEDLWLPYFCVTSNLSRATLVIKERGPLVHWVRASCSVPGIEPPVVHDGDLYVDGGVLNNLPADVMHEKSVGPVIAVDVSPAVELTTDSRDRVTLSGSEYVFGRLGRARGKHALPGIASILARTAMLSSVRNSDVTRRQADLYLHPPTDGVDPLDWKGIDRVVEIGYRFALEKLGAWMETKAATDPPA